MTIALEHLGCRFHVERRGDGPPVLFVQGTGVHGAGWAPQVDDLARDHACVWFDNRAMGRSQPVGLAPITVAQMADDARAVLDAAGWGSAHVVGHSLGGLVAIALALAARDRVRSLALVCSFASGRAATRLDARMLWIALRSRIGSRRARRRAFLRLVLPPAVHATADLDQVAADLAPLFGHDLADAPPVVMKQFSAMRACDLTSRLGELAGIPTLVMSAAHDPIARPALARALADGIPGARHLVFPDASHGLPIHDAASVNAALRAHVAAVEAGGATAAAAP